MALPHTSPPMGVPFRAADHANDNKTHLLIACTGSVATIKLPLILQALSRHRSLSIRLMLTSSTTKFLAGQSAEQPALHSLLTIPNVDGLHLDADEWDPSWTRNAPVLHIELRRWADMLLIAPLSANSLAKMALGLSDDLVSCVVRAWDATGLIDGRQKKIVVAPAMNTAMWLHPITSRHMAQLAEWEWITVLGPIEKELACKDVGGGAMMEWSEIVTTVEGMLGLNG